MVKVSFDRRANAAYIALKEIEPEEAAHQHVVEAEHTRGRIVLDFDKKGRLIAIEVLGATNALPSMRFDQELTYHVTAHLECLKRVFPSLAEDDSDEDVLGPLGN